MNNKSKNSFRSLTLSFSCVLVLMVISIALWWFWARIWTFWFNHFGSIPKSSDHQPEVFQMLEVLVAVFAMGVASLTFLIEKDRRKAEREEERRKAATEAKRTQAAFLAQAIPSFLDKLKEFSLAQDSVKIGKEHGILALESELYTPFRERELAALKSSNTAELSRIDKEFEARCQKIGFEQVANPFWELLSWVMYQQLFLDAFSGEEDNRSVGQKPVRDSFLTILKASPVLNSSLQYMLGKYRHLKYKLGVLPENGGRVLDATHGYRGTDYADYVLLYRPTLLRLPSSPQKNALLRLADERDEREFFVLKQIRNLP